MSLGVVIMLFINSFCLGLGDHKHEWEEFKIVYNKKYLPQEEPIRRALFERRLAEVKWSKSNHKSTHFLAINQFSDLTDIERKQYLGVKINESRGKKYKRGISRLELGMNSTSPGFRVYTSDKIYLPECVDLRTTGWKEPVRHQGSCGSCWAISISSLVSFHHFNQTKINQQFSPQNLIDCGDIYGTTGCLGGSPIHGLMYIAANNQTTERVYPYIGKQSACKKEKLKSLSAHKINGILMVNSNQESIKQCVAKIGPVSVSIAADHLFDYGGGVWDGTNSKTGASCELSKINHAVTIVGYCNNRTTNQSYWIIKNSWGSSWGEKGYFRMIMNDTNVCGLWRFPYAVY